MNLNKKIGFLLDSGLNPKFVSTLNENKINFLFEKLSNKKETNEQQTGVTTKITTEKVMTIDPSALKQGVNLNGVNIKQAPNGQVVAKELGENELDEKFESKAQQGLFWARCNKCESKNCKWCKMAKEFSKSTSKKQYEKMPEKKHPEKTVKYKKKKTNEEFTMANYFDKLSSVYANNVMGKTIGNLTKENIEKIIDKNLKPTMKKGDLLKLIESEIKRKKGLNEDFYMGMDEEFDFMSDTETDIPTRHRHRPDRTEDLPIGPDRTEGEPNWDEDEDEDDDIPRPRGKMGRLRMDDPGVPVIEPGIKEPGIKEPDTTPEWRPDEDEPSNPDEGVDPEPQAPLRTGKPIMRSFKDDFDRKMSRMDGSTYKPIKYRKF